MRIQRYHAFLILLVLITSTLFSEPKYFSPTTTQTFVKKVQGIGQNVQTIQIIEGGYVSLSRIGAQTLLVRKIKASTEKVWERTLHFNFPYDPFLVIAQASDGGYILAGRGNNCFDNGCPPPFRYGMLVKLRSDGRVAWKRIYSAGINTGFNSVVPNSDGGFITIGTNYSPSFLGSLQLVKFTSVGDVVWAKTFISIQNSFDQIVLTLNGGPILVSRIPNGARVIQLNDSGSIVWKKSFEMDQFNLDAAVVTSDNGLVLAGRHGRDRLALIRLQEDGKVTWKRAYSLQNLDGLSDLLQTPDGGYSIRGTIAGGSTFVFKIDSSGKVGFQQVSSLGPVWRRSIFNAPGGGFLIFSSSGTNLLISSVNSEGLAPGCNFFRSVPLASIVSFGELRVKQLTIKEVSDSPSFEIKDITVTSAGSNRSVSTVCQ